MSRSASVQDAITAVLREADREDPGHGGTLDRLLPLVYDELRRLAHGYLRREYADHTLSTTALVHEAYLKLAGQTQVTARGQTYFFGAAARAMRRILVDCARRRVRQKRGGGQPLATLGEGLLAVDSFAAELLDLDQALERLAELSPRQARVVECRFFGGLTCEETAEVLDVTNRTVARDWALARAWLYRRLHQAPPERTENPAT